MKLSSASKRAIERNYYQSCEWFCDFKESGIEGIGYEKGIHRRDPSSVIKVGDDYFVWYSRSVGPHKGFHTGDEEAKYFPGIIAIFGMLYQRMVIDGKKKGLLLCGAKECI